MSRSSQKWTRRRFVGTAAAGAATLSGLSGLSIAGVGPRIRSAAAATEITWAVNNFNPAEVTLVQKVVDNFKATHPDYEISVLGYDPNTYDQKLLTDVAAGTLPDIFVNAEFWPVLSSTKG